MKQSPSRVTGPSGIHEHSVADVRARVHHHPLATGETIDRLDIAAVVVAASDFDEVHRRSGPREVSRRFVGKDGNRALGRVAPAGD